MQTSSPLARAIAETEYKDYRKVIWQHLLRFYQEHLIFWEEMAHYVKNPEDKPLRIAAAKAKIAECEAMLLGL